MTDIDIAAHHKPLSAQEWADRLSKWADALEIPSGPFVNDDLRGAADFLSLSVSPLPEEIAGLIEKLHHQHFPGLGVVEALLMHDVAAAIERMARHLEDIERRNAELGREVEKLTADRSERIGKALEYQRRIRELEAEVKRDREAFDRLTAAHHENVAKWRERISELEAVIENKNEACGLLNDNVERLEAERDAIKAKTIEECKVAAFSARFGPPSSWSGDRPEGWHLDRPCAPEEAALHDNGCIDAAKEIIKLRARNQPAGDGNLSTSAQENP